MTELDNTPGGLKMWLLLDDLYRSMERGTFGTAIDNPHERKMAWELDRLGLVRWLGTNWGSCFFAITDDGKTLIDNEARPVRARLDAQQASS